MREHQTAVDGDFQAVWTLKTAVEGTSRAVRTYQMAVGGASRAVWAHQTVVDGDFRTVRTYQTAVESVFRAGRTPQTAVGGASRAGRMPQTVVGGISRDVRTLQTAFEGASRDVWTLKTAVEGASRAGLTYQMAVEVHFLSVRAESVRVEICFSFCCGTNAFCGCFFGAEAQRKKRRPPFWGDCRFRRESCAMKHRIYNVGFYFQFFELADITFAPPTVSMISMSVPSKLTVTTTSLSMGNLLAVVR